MGRKFDIAKFAASLEPPGEGTRDIEAVTAEIVRLKQDAGNAILAIGDRLNEAKAMLSHGKWLAWLSERVEFSESTAQRFMRLAREWRNPSALTDLGATKALTLLALPPEERDAFIAEAHSVNGEEKTVVDMTSRELEKAIRERDEARQAAEIERAQAESAEEARAKMAQDLSVLKQLHEAAQDALAKAQTELEDLRNRPVEVAVETVPDLEAVRQAREAALAEMRAKVDRAQAEEQRADARRRELEAQVKELQASGKASADALSRAQKAEAELAEARRQLEEMEEEMGEAERQTALDSDPELAAFRAIVEQVPPLINQLHGRLMKIRLRDEVAAEKMKNALLSLAEQIRRCAE